MKKRKQVVAWATLYESGPFVGETSALYSVRVDTMGDHGSAVALSNEVVRLRSALADSEAKATIARASADHANSARAIAFEEAAEVIDYAGFIDVQSNGEDSQERPAGDLIRALANTPPTMVVVERTMLESVLLRAGALLSEDGRDGENVRDIITSIANALETK